MIAYKFEGVQPSIGPRGESIGSCLKFEFLNQDRHMITFFWFNNEEAESTMKVLMEKWEEIDSLRIILVSKTAVIKEI